MRVRSQDPTTTPSPDGASTHDDSGAVPSTALRSCLLAVVSYSFKMPSLDTEYRTLLPGPSLDRATAEMPLRAKAHDKHTKRQSQGALRTKKAG